MDSEALVWGDGLERRERQQSQSEDGGNGMLMGVQFHLLPSGGKSLVLYVCAFSCPHEVGASVETLMKENAVCLECSLIARLKHASQSKNQMYSYYNFKKNYFLQRALDPSDWLSGFQLPSSIVSSGSILTLWFTTDFAVSAQGFKALYEGKALEDMYVIQMHEREKGLTAVRVCVPAVFSKSHIPDGNLTDNMVCVSQVVSREAERLGLQEEKSEKQEHDDVLGTLAFVSSTLHDTVWSIRCGP
ncbi:hypothetical protein E5288_WYG021617 [Bos mutus]|uniref:CUB domain-containing protein n=1 Tax=Bos mutus TaxID=72004 RepID=A0A6B0S2H8_9CETA|nr:hypothetical protein [Bos mutus]